MRKRLLIVIAVINAIMFSISLSYASVRVGLTFESYHGMDFSYFIFPTVYFILFLVSCAQAAWHSFSSGKSYYVSGFATLAFICAAWVNCHTLRMGYRQVGIPSVIVLDMIVFPAILFALSLVSCVLYILCAVNAKKDNQITLIDPAN